MAAEPDKFDRKELEAWLEGNPDNVSVAFATRCALRLFPYFGNILDHPAVKARVFLPYFRANSLMVSFFAGSEYTSSKSDVAVNIYQAASAFTHYAASDDNATAAAKTSAEAVYTLNGDAYAAAMSAALDIYRAAGTSASIAIKLDQQNTDSGCLASDLIAHALWPDGQIPDEIYKNWEYLKADLLSRDEDWDVWTDWYDDRLAGHPPEEEILAVARVTLPEPMWEQGPKLVNAAIRKLTDLSEKGGPEAVEERMEEFRRQYPEEPGEADDHAAAVLQGTKANINENDTAETKDPNSDIFPDADTDPSTEQTGKSTFFRKNLAGGEPQSAQSGNGGGPPGGGGDGGNDGDDPPPTQPPDGPAGDGSLLPRAWLLQYTPENRVARWVKDARPGSLLRWKSGNSFPRDIELDDPVIYWRTIHPKNKQDRGGLVGTGHVVSTETELENGIYRFPTEVHEFEEENRIERDEAVKAAGLAFRNWQGAVKHLTPEQALGLDALLRQYGRQPIFTDQQLIDAGFVQPPDQTGPTRREDTEKSVKNTGSGSTGNSDASGSGGSGGGASDGTGTGNGAETDGQFVPDDAETEEDSLGRGVLAVALARRLHLIWRELNGTNKSASQEMLTAQAEAVDSSTWAGHTEESCFFDRSRENTRAAFVLHLDAPWGGGKTTFGNFLARVLNPSGFEHGPNSFLRQQGYDDEDIRTVFLGEPAGKSGTGDGRALPIDARRPWIIVPFNAWQAEHVKPPWWVFYQTIRRRCFSSVACEGVAPVSLGKSRKPHETGARPSFATWLGLWWHELAWRFSSPKVLTLLITALVSGTLLLLFGWLGIVDIIGTKGRESVGFSLTDGFGWLLGGLTTLSLFWSIGSVFTESIRPGTDTLAERLSLGSGDPFERFRQHFYETMERVKRPVLVVVDDLDRCKPEFVVDLVRGMQTLLRSPRVVFVVLGDRDWIERAFEVHHKDMNKVNVGKEQTFGARFVEKAIQMSFILPGLEADKQKSYVRRLLLGRKADVKGKTPKTDQRQAAAAMRTAFQAVIREEPKAAQLNQSELKERVRRNVATAVTPQDNTETVSSVLSDDTVFNSLLKDEMTKFAAVDEQVETEITHRLEPLADNLPANPRQIKRIVNQVTFYNAVAIRERDWADNSPRWLQLARWIVIMTEWPQSWRALASFPALVGLLYAEDAKTALFEMRENKELDAELSPDDDAVLAEVQRQKGDPNLMALIKGESDDVKLDRAAVLDLSSLTPLHSRETELTSPELSDEKEDA